MHRVRVTMHAMSRATSLLPAEFRTEASLARTRKWRRRAALHAAEQAERDARLRQASSKACDLLTRQLDALQKYVDHDHKMHPEGPDLALGATFGALKSVVTPLCASPLAAAAFATAPPATRRESATPNWARAQAERTRTLRQSFGDSLGGDAALEEVREAQAREAEARRERAEAARREERSRRRVHDTFFGRAHMI